MKHWTNKELDGTIFITAILVIFALNCIFSYAKAEFANLPTTEKTFEIIKDVLLIIVGYLFRKAAENTESSGEKETAK